MYRTDVKTLKIVVFPTAGVIYKNTKFCRYCAFLYVHIRTQSQFSKKNKLKGFIYIYDDEMRTEYQPINQYLLFSFVVVFLKLSAIDIGIGLKKLASVWLYRHGMLFSHVFQSTALTE